MEPGAERGRERKIERGGEGLGCRLHIINMDFDPQSRVRLEANNGKY